MIKCIEGKGQKQNTITTKKFSERLMFVRVNYKEARERTEVHGGTRGGRSNDDVTSTPD